jgi:hypothetical protein
VLSRLEDTSYLFIATTVEGLKKGVTYRFQTRAVNKLGVSPWSEQSYSSRVRAGAPEQPAAPFPISSDLTSIQFGWNTPEDHGSAIIGYRLKIQHTGDDVALTRYQSTYTLDNLLPGRVYRIQVKAKNSVGYSPYSEWSSETESRTKTDKPEKPLGVRAIAGSFSFVTLEGRLPCANGDPIRAMLVQKRYIEAFSKGGWEPPIEYKIPEEVIIVEEVDYEAQTVQQAAIEIATKKKKLIEEKERRRSSIIKLDKPKEKIVKVITITFTWVLFIL